ncbi:hypothetical protein [Rhodoferax sp.]|uniref:hypothetical protein n=1 Tax=Rhodoferax sp. TaxID=50421 RepID=UPI00272B9C47|nr:hypothetical protein [Rhodoferax sp.]
MPRNIRALFLLVVLFWQSMAMFGSMSVAQRAGEWEHMVVHGQDSSHHHHADHALHMEDGEGAVQHLHPDAGNNTAGLFTSQWPAMARVRSMAPPETIPAAWLSPTLEGPLRPPMLNA